MYERTSSMSGELNERVIRRVEWEKVLEKVNINKRI